MKERPMLFSGAMVRAILDGRKTQTRRVIKPQPLTVWPIIKKEFGWQDEHALQDPFSCPLGQPGDQLWVREAFYADLREKGVANPAVIYAATPELAKYKYDAAPRHCTFPDETLVSREQAEANLRGHRFQRLKPSIHMPRWASRLTREIVDVRAERLAEISEADARAEGFNRENIPPLLQKADPHRIWPIARDFRELFAMGWDCINAKRGFGWKSNPWVWAVTFKRL